MTITTYDYLFVVRSHALFPELLHVATLETKMARSLPLLAKPAVLTSQEIKDCNIKRAVIAAIDFGTTFCSLAYTLPNEDTVNFVELNQHQKRVPTAILLQKQTVADGTEEQMMIRDFGFEAQSQTSTLLNEERPDHIYFELVKMLLYNDKVSRCTASSCFSVLAFILL